MEMSAQAIAILDDPERTFASSEFVRLEVLPKAVFNGRRNEAEFYDCYFQAVTHWPAAAETIVKRAYDLGLRFGLAALDALHIAAALETGAEELITTEKLGKPIHRAPGIRVRSIQAELP